MVLQYYGIQVRREVIRKTLGYTLIGTQSSNILQIASLGVRVQYGRAKSEGHLNTALERQVPPICLVDTGALPYWRYSCQHAVVVLSASPRQVILNDPAHAEKRQKVDLEAFMLAWSDMDYLHALIEL
jgi:ABC-type bacteriocin/lantibiotic exporter with double-glycine peptidase domain